MQIVWKKCIRKHIKKIRENPEHKKKERRKEGHYVPKYKPRKKNAKDRKNRVNQILAHLEKSAL